jgi:tetratricopeptide (TPR) repeat protein
MLAFAAFLAGCAPLHQDLARTALQDGRLNDAVREIQLALAAHPDDPSLKPLAAAIYTNRGARFYDAHEMTSALADLNRALGYDADYSAAYDYRGLVAFSAHNWKDAIVDGERAAALAGRPPAAYVAAARRQLSAAPPGGYHAVGEGRVNR